MNDPGPLAWLERGLDACASLQDMLFAHVIEPAMRTLGMMSYMEDGYLATQWLLVGAAQIIAMLCLFGPLERLRPFERTVEDAGARRERHHAIFVDVVYTLIDRLGLLRLALFFLLDPLWNGLFGRLAVLGVDGWHLDQWIAPLWPGVSDAPLAGFFVYVLVLDGFAYFVHLSQHRFEWWWSLHAVHHSQRHMTYWTDSRNHLLDTMLVDTLFVLLARIIGVAPSQFVLLVALSKLVESLSHANANLRFGRVGERLMVGPRFHRIHHGIGVGHERAGDGHLGGCNFAVLLPLWDVLFCTARFDLQPGPTGVRDQLPPWGARDYGRGFWAQQGLGIERLWRALTVGARRRGMPGGSR